MNDFRKMYSEEDYDSCINDQNLLLEIDSCGLDFEGISSGFIPSPASETMEMGTKPNPATQIEFPFCPRGPPQRMSYPGELNFQVEVNSNDVHKKTFLYSHQLCRIYVDMKCNFSVQFNWDYLKAPHMFVRSTVVFSDETQAEKRVERCVQHFHESSTSGEGEIFGRQKVGARVCACPRRDMLKDETAEGVYKTGKKRIPSNQIEPPKTKKIKVENLMEFDDAVHKLPPLQIVGSRAMLCGLKVMLEMMELAFECRKNDPESTALHEKPISDLRDTIKKLENAKKPPQ
ncbi:hypothetical protein B5X24_HaOG210037 [Helicoverpa armigera]|nr:hypothetical protein B5X24_HaOG210037 [Helicoverpa armigera]